MPLAQPQRDNDGTVKPHDHEGIHHDDSVIRRISEQQLVDDPKTGRRVSSLAFKPSSGNNGGMSVDIEKLILESGLDPRQFVTTPRWMGSLLFKAGDLRKEGYWVGYDPVPKNPYHGQVWGRFTKTQQHQLQRLASWYVALDGVSLDRT